MYVDLLPVALSRREVEDYYHGFANRTLWPLLHGLVEQPLFRAPLVDGLPGRE
jgi:trehalose 6-phosphate synthase